MRWFCALRRASASSSRRDGMAGIMPIDGLVKSGVAVSVLSLCIAR
jgi:hypothetical protein